MVSVGIAPLYCRSLPTPFPQSLGCTFQLPGWVSPSEAGSSTFFSCRVLVFPLANWDRWPQPPVELQGQAGDSVVIEGPVLGTSTGPPRGDDARAQPGPLSFRPICPSPGKSSPLPTTFLSTHRVARALKEDAVLQWEKMPLFNNFSRSFIWSFSAIRGFITKENTIWRKSR